MESTTTDQQFFAAEETLSEPHFDEEATILSARPVVLLATIDGAGSVQAKRSFPRPWILGLALGSAVLVGIFATTVYYSRLNRNDVRFDDAELVAGVQATSTEAHNSFSGPAAAQPSVNADTTAEASWQAPAKDQPVRSSTEPAKKPVARLVAVIREKSSNQTIETREDRKAARRHARQERRRTEREKRDARSSDELLRIRDIFEGSPRP